MSDPRVELRAMLGRWLRVRGSVRALAAKLAAAEYALQRDARRGGEPEMATLAAQLAAERGAIAALAGELDARITGLQRDFDRIATAFVQELQTAAQRTGQHCAGDPASQRR